MSSLIKSRKLKTTAFHEAGHAVMACILHVPLGKVTNLPGEGRAGSCHFAKIFRPRNFTNRDRLVMEKHIMIALAGGIAQRISDPKTYRYYHCETDHSEAAQMALTVTGSAAETNAYIAWLSVRTEETLRQRLYWDVVQAVATELMRRRTLGGNVVRKILRDKMMSDLANAATSPSLTGGANCGPKA
jgi:hypothetical protein